MFDTIKPMLTRIKNEKPLILNITNDVTMDFIANGLLSLGASPIMSKAQEEMSELVTFAQSIVINLGTLNNDFVMLCHEVCRLANQFEKPIILDPVGAGATRYRTTTAQQLLSQYEIAILRGNASEVMSLTNMTTMTTKTKGVDSTAQSYVAVENAKELSSHYDMAVVISGPTDIIVDRDHYQELHYGSALMPQVTGTGCLFSAIVAAFHAVEKNRFAACVAATAFYGMCGEKAAQAVRGPGSFKVKFLDELNTKPEDFTDA